MLKFYFSRKTRAFAIVLHEASWPSFALSLLGLWWLLALPWLLLVMLHYEPGAWPVVAYNAVLFGGIGLIGWLKARPAPPKISRRPLKL